VSVDVVCVAVRDNNDNDRTEEESPSESCLPISMLIQQPNNFKRDNSHGNEVVNDV
jgi:hypothetical protein